MSLRVGIVGLPNVGKSTLFNAITNSRVEAANYPFATIEPNVGVVAVPDNRIDEISKLINPDKKIYSTIEFTDIAGLVAGASKGEGLGNKFLANIRETDAIVQVVRCFEDPDITHVSGSVDPTRDVEIINLELLLADIETVTKVIDRTKRKAQMTTDKSIKAEFDVASKLMVGLEKSIPIRSIDLSAEEKILIKSYQLLTAKPILYVANISEEFASNPLSCPIFQKLNEYTKSNNDKLIGISVKIEQEISELDDESKEMFLEDIGLSQSGLDFLIKEAYELLDLKTFFTAGKQEVRAWTFKNGMTAPECAGVIHTDFQRGFIKAEVVSYEDFIKHSGFIGAKEVGKIRLEGKSYVFQDGDISLFRFNV